MKKKYSQNLRAEQIMGKRDLPENCIPFDFPCELGFHCPVCKYPMMKHGNYDERLHWSEYNSFIWCSVCNKDYPSCMCIPLDKPLPTFLTRKRPINYAIDLFLISVEEAKGAGKT